MYYFVIGADDSRYGPADIDALVEWAREGRVVASTILIERGTEQELRADSITAIAAALRREFGDEPAVAIDRDQPGPGERVAAPGAGEGGGPSPRPPPVPSSPPVPQARPPATPYAPGGRVSHRNKVVAGLLGIFLGGFGVHRFYLGYTGIGVLMLVLCVLGGTVGLVCIPVPCVGGGFVWLWGFLEGIVCLCGGMRDAGFP